MALKPLYLNGVQIGEYEHTGDMEKDVQAQIEVLSEKAPGSKLTPVQLMFYQARAFWLTAFNLFERDLQSPPQNWISGAPFAVNAAFSTEVYLKTLHAVLGRTARGHSLLRLYDDLPANIKQSLTDIASEYAPKFSVPVSKAERFFEMVADMDNNFVTWRYLYETGDTNFLRIYPNLLVMKVLDEVCLAHLPKTWPGGRPIGPDGWAVPLSSSDA